MEELISFNPTTSVLFVGEGNFSFSNLLTEHWQQSLAVKNNQCNTSKADNSTLNNVYSTCYEDKPVSEFASRNVECLRQRGVNVHLGIDATKSLEQNHISCESFDKIVFMFPHIGGKMKIKKNRDLLRDFSKNMVKYLDQRNKDAVIIVTLCGGQGGTPFDPIQRSESDTWQIVKMLSSANLLLKSIGLFNINDYINVDCEAYDSYGYRGINKNFNVKHGVVHVFAKSKRIEDLKLEKRSDFLNCQYESLEKMKGEYVRRKIAQVYDNTSNIGQKLEHLIQYIRKSCDLKVALSSEPLLKQLSSFTLEKEVEESKLSLENKKSKIITIEIIVHENFEMNFHKYPLEVYVLIRNCAVIKAPIKQEFSSALVETECSELLLRLADIPNCDWSNDKRLNTQESKSDGFQWQMLWSETQSLYPPKYCHCLSFWLPDHDNSHQNGEKLDENMLAPILWCCGFDTVTSCEIVDIYKENSRQSNTLKIEYQSYNFALSSELALDIQVNSIAKALKSLFCIEIR